MVEQNYPEGGCLCGKVRFQITTSVEKVIACHCEQCRIWSGHFWASVACPTGSLKFLSDIDSISWNYSSDHAKRSFCLNCGSSLFWKLQKDGEPDDYYAVAAGFLKNTDNLRSERHIICRSKGRYYQLNKNTPFDETY